MTSTGTYTFPCDLAQILRDTPTTMSTATRKFRQAMIESIVEASHKYDQHTIDTRVYADVIPNRRIIGVDFMNIDGDEDMNVCRGRRVPIGQLTASAWTNMRIGPPMKQRYRLQ